ncbi:MAG: hypothetical protein R6W88_07225 [Desulfobacterales bacterium]
MEFKNLKLNILHRLGKEWIQSNTLKTFKKSHIFDEFSDIPANNIEDAINALKDADFLETNTGNNRIKLTQKGLAKIESRLDPPKLR